jgi:hypothetical protein
MMPIKPKIVVNLTQTSAEVTILGNFLDYIGYQYEFCVGGNDVTVALLALKMDGKVVMVFKAEHCCLDYAKSAVSRLVLEKFVNREIVEL